MSTTPAWAHLGRSLILGPPPSAIPGALCVPCSIELSLGSVKLSFWLKEGKPMAWHRTSPRLYPVPSSKSDMSSASRCTHGAWRGSQSPPVMLGCLGVSQLPFCLWIKIRMKIFSPCTLCLNRITQNILLTEVTCWAQLRGRHGPIPWTTREQRVQPATSLRVKKRLEK